jgi:hypothetical protein
MIMAKKTTKKAKKVKYVAPDVMYGLQPTAEDLEYWPDAEAELYFSSAALLEDANDGDLVDVYVYSHTLKVSKPEPPPAPEPEPASLVEV